MRRGHVAARVRGNFTHLVIPSDAPDEEEIPLPAEEVLKQPRMFSWRDLLAACPPDAPAHRWELDASGEDLYSEHVQHEADSAYQLDAAQGSFVFDNIREGDACYNPKISKMHGNFIRPVLGEKLRRNRLYPSGYDGVRLEKRD